MAVNTKILGVNIDASKKVLYSLQGIFGIGKSTAAKILSKVGVDPELRVKDIDDESFNKIRLEIENGDYVLEGDLRQKIYKDITRLKAIKCYRGYRHRVGLPVRGQNTRRNARTRKGRVKVAVGGLKKKLQKK
ncbi:MAG: 30S ribosomal protein S13 [Candidatus Dojkabacteria bacterium]|nr:MAG: 30S ribosomal protein S13 [Candidatus Dojkabacteria bacterium]